MIETFLVEHPFAAIGIWAAIYVSDYYFTLWGATLYKQRAQAFVELGGSYELEQLFRKDIDALRRISPQFLLRLLISAAGLLLLWWLAVRVGGYPEFFLVGFGAYSLTEVVIHIRHIRNVVFFRALAVPGAAQGHIKYARWVADRISTADLLSFAAFFALCYALSGRWLFVGGLLGCLSVMRRHAIRARKERHAIRRATPDDAAAVGRIHVESWSVAYRGIMPDDVIARTDLAYRTEFWRERIGDPEWPVFLIEELGEAVAFCQMIPSRDEDDDPTRVGHITSLHVLPHLRGQGHGRALVDRVIAEFKRRRFREVTLWVLEGNKPARRFYERYGFRLDRGTRTYPKTNVPEIRYRFRIK